MAKKSTNGSKSQFQIRLDGDAEARINKYRESLEKNTDLEVTFASATRALIMKGLEAVKF